MLRRKCINIYGTHVHAPCFFPSYHAIQKRMFVKKPQDYTLASVKRDGTFKAIFQDKERVTSFINSVLEHEGSPKIIDVAYRDTRYPGFTSREKNIVADIVCESSEPNPRIFILEMQRAWQQGFINRWGYSASRAYTTELMATGKYNKLKNVHVIAVMEHATDFPNDTYVLTGRNSKTVIDKILKISLFSLSSFTPNIEPSASMLEKWLHFIKYSGTPDLNVNALATEHILLNAIEYAKTLQQQPPPPIVEEQGSGTTWKLLNSRVKGL